MHMHMHMHTHMHMHMLMHMHMSEQLLAFLLTDLVLNYSLTYFVRTYFVLTPTH